MPVRTIWIMALVIRIITLKRLNVFHTEPPDFFSLEKHYHRNFVFLSVVGIDARFPPDRAKGHYPS